MRTLLAPLLALLLSAGILILGNGLQGTLLPVRAQLEGFSTVAIGLLGSSYFLGFGLGCVAGPFVIKRVGHIRTFAALAAVASALSLIHAIFPHPLPWTLLRVLAGFAFAGLYTVIESWLNERTSNETRGAILSTYIVVNLSAITLGQLLLDLDDPRGFALFSLVAILTALAVVPVSLTTAAAPAPLAQVRLRLGRLYAISPVGVVGCFLVGVTNGPFWTLAPAYVTGLGRDVSVVALFMACAVVAGALMQWPLGRLSDRFDRRLVIIGACLGAALGALGLALVPDSLWLLFLSAALFGALALSMYALCIAHANDFIESADAVEASSGLLLIFAIGAVIGPLIGSTAMTLIGPGGLFATTATAHLLLAGFSFYRMRQRTAVPAEERENFVMMEPRTGTVVFEMDPRAEPTAEGTPPPEEEGGDGSAAPAAEKAEP